MSRHATVTVATGITVTDSPSSIFTDKPLPPVDCSPDHRSISSSGATVSLSPVTGFIATSGLTGSAVHRFTGPSIRQSTGLLIHLHHIVSNKVLFSNPLYTHFRNIFVDLYRKNKPISYMN